MGIFGLPKLIKAVAGRAAVRTYQLDKFKDKGWTVAVDTSLMIHQTVIAIRSCGKDMKNKSGQLTSHLQGLFFKTIIFLEHGITPIHVFDGKASDLKQKTILIRTARKDLASKKLESLDDSEGEEYIKQFKQTFKPTKEDINEAKIMFDLMGIPYVVAPEEADVVCSWLAARHDANGKRFAKGVCSDDSDMLPLGSPYLFKNMLKFINKKKEIEVISLEKTLVKMKLTMSQFVDLCVLLGTDYCTNIPGIGPKGAYKMILRYGSLEKVLEAVNKRNGKDNDDSSTDSDNDQEISNEECMLAAKNYFNTALTKLDDANYTLSENQLKLRQFQYEELMDFMCVKHNFDVEKIQNAINRIKQAYIKLNVARPNTGHFHTILQPRSENYIFKALTDDIEFLSDSDEEPMPTKKTSGRTLLIKSKPKPKKKIDIVYKKKAEYQD